MDETQFGELIRRRARHEASLQAESEDEDTQRCERLLFAQEYLEHDPFDYKAYAIGRSVHAIKRVFPARTEAEKLGTPVGDDPELVDLAHRCGELFGLELYGVDLIKTPTGFSVVEVNCFPGYKGVPQAGERLSQFILERGF